MPAPAARTSRSHDHQPCWPDRPDGRQYRAGHRPYGPARHHRRADRPERATAGPPARADLRRLHPTGRRRRQPRQPPRLRHLLAPHPRKWGPRRLDEPTPLEIRQFAEEVRRHAVVRRNHRGGAAAAEHLISALRCVYHYAIADRLLDPADNPATRVDKPRRQPSLRHALPDAALAAIIAVAAETGNDPGLDSLILRLHVETACRRGGALALRRQDLDVEQCLVLLREKGQTQRWQPVSPTLMAALVAHDDERGNGAPAGQLLRYHNGKPVGRRRYDHLWQRIGKHLPWVAVQQISVHWLRHTTLTWVERHYSYAIARAYAGHADSSDAGATVTYVKATLQEIAQALAGLTGERHPLADADPMTAMLTVPTPMGT
ncbi:tyrosine-type recombinase/integrase [Actinoplanes sp. NPDC051513]|uniref:tyrosine-type recombinase/integrase n=1 Tax=Actinoplanes sp. NPDC051513 TaxID=3363908 RepID=UPI0037AFE594